jgi:pSer/pThr/pTyr-binding forkhead associated (FHA) protein
MINCDDCGAQLLPGTLFCKECGFFLLQDNDQTEQIAPGKTQKIYFLIAGSQRQGELETRERIWIGRADPDDQFWPQLDLTGDGGVEMGVSRRHALIRKQEEGLVLIDRHSVNGTWIDQERLVPDQPYPLGNVSEVRFGRLTVQLFLE